MPNKAMRAIEIKLNGSRQIEIGSGVSVIMQRRDCHGRNDCLHIRFPFGKELDLLAAVDVSEQLDGPRVFSIDGSERDLVILFGGEILYWVGADGTLKAQVRTFREWQFAEYWTTEIIEYQATMVIVYEAGVLMIDDGLNIAWHSRKYFNDIFHSIEGQALRFVRDDDTEWLMGLDDGSGFVPAE